MQKIHLLLAVKGKVQKGDESISKRASTREEVENIMERLQEKHKDKYTVIQLRLWANMLQLGTHRDYESPPNCPMFGGGKKKPKKKSELVDALSGIAEGVMNALSRQGASDSKTHTPEKRAIETPDIPHGISPGKCVHLRSQYIGQLKQLHALFEDSAITKQEYDQQKEEI